jgi:mRNA interferase MazF
MEQNYKQFDIVLVDFGTDTFDSEQAGIRPAVIVQNNKGNFFSTTTLVMPLTSAHRKLGQPTHSLIKKNKTNGLLRDSVLLGECLRQVSEKRINSLIGSFTTEYEINEVKRVYRANFGE